ncbi:UNVERIFIED_CONTAM: hypothetical protein Sangu_3190100 [Sesamum angustifolium]|uniref:Uncharacterized protein n=1 Tax=Sesamum angustifolium TaxID=2727405 RepID=A0AAW2JMV2_9LAMI
MSSKLNTIFTLSGSVLNSNSFWSKIFSGWLYLKNSHQHPSEPFLRCFVSFSPISASESFSCLGGFLISRSSRLSGHFSLHLITDHRTFPSLPSL